jgi:hypothetical protein
MPPAILVLAALATASGQAAVPVTGDERMIIERLADDGDIEARMALVDLIERLQPSDREAAGRVALLRVRAIGRVLEVMPGVDTASGNPAIKRYTDLGAYDEFSGQWRVPYATAFALAAEHRGTAAADDIMWFGVTSGIGQECEGHVPCYAYAENQLVGEYLRRFPRGRHADEAIATLTSVADQALRLVKDPKLFDRRMDCKDLLESLTPLRAAVDATAATGQPRASALLARLAAVCRDME